MRNWLSLRLLIKNELDWTEQEINDFEAELKKFIEERGLKAMWDGWAISNEDMERMENEVRESGSSD